MTEESRLWLADAYVRLERWEECVSELEQIDHRLSDPGEEARKNYNHAVVLATLGRVPEAIAVLDRSWDLEWPEAIRADAAALRKNLREGHLSDLRVLH